MLERQLKFVSLSIDRIRFSFSFIARVLLSTPGFITINVVVLVADVTDFVAVEAQTNVDLCNNLGLISSLADQCQYGKHHCKTSQQTKTFAQLLPFISLILFWLQYFNKYYIKQRSSCKGLQQNH